MKIVLIHGDNTAKVHDRVRAIVDGVHKKGWKVERLSKNDRLDDVFMSNTLLPESKLCIFEGVNNLTKENTSWLKNNLDTLEGSFLIVNYGDAPKKSLQPIAKNLTEEHFPLPKKLFTFLESLTPGRAEASLRLLHEVLQTENVEFVVAMMGRHLRDLFWVKTAPDSMTYPEWRMKKLNNQSRSYGENSLEIFIDELAQLDYESKTGGLPIAASVDLLIMRQLS